jgi:DNA-binding beta-propeller fold protein YncE
LFSIYEVEKPLGVAVDPAGQRICVTESGGERVTRVFDREGNELLVLAPPNTVPAERAPTYVAIDRLGTVYVSDRMRHTIDMYDVNGIYLGTFAPRNNPGISWSPLGITFDSSGNLYVTEVTDLKHRVMVFDPSGELKLEFGQQGKGEGEFSFPNDIAVDASGRIYVADSNNFRIQVFDALGQPLGAFTRGGQEAVGFPRGMAIEGNYLYVVDTFSHLVRVYDLSQGVEPVFTFGGRGIGDAEFNFPNGLALDSTGRLYITDRENNRVQVWGY